MDPPYESSNTATAFRIMESAINKGHNITVFAYEGATSLTLKHQKGHPNPVKDTTAAEEKHPLTKDFVTGLFGLAREKGTSFRWVNCGFCVDERGVGEWDEGPERGGPPQFAEMYKNADQTLIIPTSR